MKITLALALLTFVTTSTAAADPQQLSVAREVKLLIAKEHQARKSNPNVDFAKLHRLCGTSQQWTKGCRFWKATSGKDKFLFQVRRNGKIYGIPSMFL